MPPKSRLSTRIWLLVLAGLVVVAGLALLVSNWRETGDQDTALSEADDLISAAQPVAMREADVPELPFPDNPDPSQCGIPSQWSGDARAWLNGYYEGELVQPVVYLYDSHNRFRIKAQAPHGTEVRVVLYQINPVVNYYMVRVVGLEGTNEGWIPAPFLSFDPVEAIQGS